MASLARRLMFALTASAGLASAATAQTVATYHGAADRGGLYVTPGLTWTQAAKVTPDTGFAGAIQGDVYAQPLYWLPPGATTGLVIVATEQNTIYALQAATGAVVWQHTLAAPAPLNTLGCGNIDPVGITGTPVIDPVAGTLYVDALTHTSGGPRHQIFALGLASGHTLAGWPVSVQAGMHALGRSFDSATQGQRSALTIANGMLYVAYGGNFGDCSPYHGTVVELALGTPKITGAWSTRASQGGIWAQSGIASDGQSLFVATGNTNTGAAQKWGDGEAVIRLQPGLAHSKSKLDWFTPSNWHDLDNGDTDLGGTGPIPVDVPAAGGTTLPRLLALGKDGNAYLLDRARLGGIGGQLAVSHVSSNEIITAAARFPTATAAMVVFAGPGASCPANQSGNLTMLRIAAHETPPISTAWCADPAGGGAPIVTTTDGTTDPIVWAVDTPNGQLRGFRATDGAPLYAGGSLSGLQRKVTVLAAEGRFYVAGTGRVYAFTW